MKAPRKSRPTDGKRSKGELKAHDPARLAAYEEHRKKLQDAGVVPRVHPLLANNHEKKTPANVALFIEHLAKGWTVGVAATLIDVSRMTIERWKREDDDFRALFDEAVETGTDFIEQEARRRAVEGVDRPVFQQGECVGFTREYSDTLMTQMLSGRRPQVYGKQRHEISGPNGGPVNYDVQVSFETPK